MTESSHPKTASLSQTVQRDLAEGIRMLLSVDEEIAPSAAAVFRGEAFARLVAALSRALRGGGRIFFTGCGATGRLAILLEAAWRGFWQRLRRHQRDLPALLAGMEDRVVSVMAGGDYALVRSVEGFEDHPRFGKHQLRESGVGPGDVVVAITEGGETPFVIGTAWQGVDAGADVFFVFNNPADVLRRNVERSRQVLDDPRIVSLDLTTGPMAVAGSTRMQATTAELLVVGAALETALLDLVENTLPSGTLGAAGCGPCSPAAYADRMAALVEELGRPAALDALVRWTRLEQSVYERKGLVTYAAADFLLDVLTDTTERAPTFRLPPFRKWDDTVSAPSWAFVKNPRLSTRDAWHAALRRVPRGLAWTADTYRELDAPATIRDDPPRLGIEDIYRFQIGGEADRSRWEAADSAWVMMAVGDEARALAAADHPLRREFERRAADFRRTAAVCVGPEGPADMGADPVHVPVDLPPSPLDLWHHLAVKLALNTVSTATMARMGRVHGNWMVHVETSNKKLIDRGTRLIAELTGLSYEEACLRLHEAMDEVAPRQRETKDAPSPVALAIERIGLGAGAGP